MEQKKLRPAFGASFSHGWITMMKYFLILLLVVIVMGLIMIPLKFGNLNFMPEHYNWGSEHFNWGGEQFNFFTPGFAVFGIMALVLGLFALAYVLLVVPIFKYGSSLIFVHAARDIRPKFETLIQGFKENYLYIVLANLLATALIMLGFIFLIIPGIIVACRLAFVSYLVMDKKLDPIIAVEESWKLTKGHGWTIFFMGFVSIFIFILGLALLFVGVLPAIMWISSSFASLYEAVLTEKNAQIESA